jgi:hypothetical protein
LRAERDRIDAGDRAQPRRQRFPHQRHPSRRGPARRLTRRVETACGPAKASDLKCDPRFGRRAARAGARGYASPAEIWREAPDLCRPGPVARWP